MKNILLFVPVPKKDAFSKIKKSKWQKTKSFIKRRLEIEKAIHTGRVQFSGYHHMNSYHANRGDLAIALAIETQLTTLFGSKINIETIGWDDLSEFGTKRINSNYDYFLIGGGGYVFIDKYGRLNDRVKDYKVFKNIDIPISAYGIGLNRLMHEGAYSDHDFEYLPNETRNYIRNMSSCLKEISARDFSTCSLFERVANREVTLTGDPALSMFKNIEEMDRSSMRNKQTKCFGVNLACHGWRALTVLESIIPDLVKFYRRAIDQGYKMQYFVHDDSELSIVEYLRRKGLKFETVQSDPFSMVAEYSNMSFVVSQMLHSSIMAFSAGTPTINIAYDTKNTAFFQLFNLSYLSIPWTEAGYTKIIDIFTIMEKESENIKREIISRRNFLVSKQFGFLQKLENQHSW